MTVDATLRSSVVAQLLHIGEQRGGSIPTFIVNSYAEDIAVDRSTIRKWVQVEREQANIEPPAPQHLEALTDDHIEVIFSCFGDLTKAKEKLDQSDPAIAAMSYSTFWRRWQDVNPAIKATATDGLKGLLGKQARLEYSTDERNAIWHIDHQELPLWVLARHNETTPQKPWLTTVIDDCTRRIMAVVLTIGRPASTEVVVALADAIRKKTLPNGQVVGGSPTVLHSDNGADFKSNHVKQMLTQLGISATHTYPYRSHLNGKVERVHLTIQDDLIKMLPGYSQAPEFRSLGDLYGLEAPLLGEEALQFAISEWVDSYNAEHSHSSLGGRTPDEVWCSQQTELRFPDPEAIRLAMLTSGRTYKVQQKGIHFNNRYYTTAELNRLNLVGAKVEVRYLPRDDSFIEVFVDGKWKCTAFPHANLTADQRAELIRTSRELTASAENYWKAGAQRRRDEAEADPINAGRISAAASGGELTGDDSAFLELIEAPGSSGSSTEPEEFDSGDVDSEPDEGDS